ncbi:MAG: CBS domain-containing protein [Anaerovoracaceae bacterium]
MIVKELMSTSINCCREDSSLEHIAAEMKSENIGIIPICNDRGEVLGIVTDRDLVLRSLCREGKGWGENLSAKDVMSTNLVFASPNMNTHHAALLLAKYQVRRLPVTENNKLVGMLSMADIARKTAYIDEAGDALSSICAVTHSAK